MKSLTGLMAGQCYSVSVVRVSCLPSDTATRNITLVTNPGNISIDVVSTYSHGFSLMINLTHYVENGIYHIMNNVTWLRFLHCNNGLGGSNVTDQAYDGNPTNLIITGLVPNSEYNMTVVVGNALGSRTQSVFNQTQPAAPSAPPQDIVAVNQTLFTITISWQPVDCAHQNGNITGYEIRYRKEDGGNTEAVSVRVIMGADYTLTDLQPSTTYLIQVAANNTVGRGVFGSISASTLFEVHVISTTSTSINISWAKVDYEVLITWISTLSSNCTQNIDQSLKKDSLNGKSSYVIDGLKVFTEYNITLCINGSICTFKTVVTNATAPSAPPKGMSWEGSSSTNITIKWGPVPCADRNGNITSYVVMFRENGKEIFYNEATTGGDMEFTITGLQRSTEYEIKVAAFTVAVGPFTNESLFASTTAGTREGGSNVGGVVASVILSVLFLIGATLGILATIWLMRRKKSTMKGLFSMGHFKVMCKQSTLPHSRGQDISLEKLSTGGSLAGAQLSSE
ncbi:Netrin receptor DCC [Geodia barretti]|uniref:Netrin receptor DCC n=1 Tax=Geodia barretti TaxID=519541 RepID=A0AA35RT29_GEOBA|nr:Netrin receptor DCC [Geodia barretti]